MPVQQLGRQVAPADAQVLAAVAQHVDHLQGLAEAHAPAQHQVGRRRQRARLMPDRHRGPEFAHAAGHQIGIAVEIGHGGQCRHLPGAFVREGAQVEFHALGQGGHDAAHGGAVGVGQLVEHVEGRADRLQQHLFVRQGLLAGDLGGQSADQLAPVIGTVHAGAQRQQQRQPLRRGNQRRIGDGVRRAGQQVGEPHGVAHAGGQDAQRQVERAGHPLQQRAEQENPVRNWHKTI
ncbi:hypothetical protein D3C87_1068460 [compost metagenome]